MKIWVILTILAVMAEAIGTVRYRIISGRIQRVVNEWSFAVISILITILASVIFLAFSNLEFIRTSSEFLIATRVAVAVAICTMFFTVWMMLIEEMTKSSEEIYFRRLIIVISLPLFVWAAIVMIAKLQERIRLDDVTDIGLYIIGGLCAIAYAICLYRLTIIGGNIKRMQLERKLIDDDDCDDEI